MTHFGHLFQQEDGIYSIHRLSKLFNCSQAKTLNICQELNEDFKELKFPRLITYSGKVKWQREKYSQSLYFQYLVRQSLPYKFLKTTLLRPEVTIETFCSENYISRATVARKLKEFIDRLKIYSIKINLSQMMVTGPESSVRMLYSSFLWMGSHGSELTSDRRFESERELLEKMSISKQNYMNPKEALLVLSVSKLRYLQGYPLQSSPFKGLVLPKTELEVQRYLRSFIPDMEQLRNHLDFIGYQLFYAPYYINEDDGRLPFILQHYHELKDKNDTIYQALLELLEHLEEDNALVDIDPASELLLKLNIFTTLLTYSIQNGPMPLTLYSLSQSESLSLKAYEELYKSIYLFLTKVSRRKKFTWIKNCQAIFAETLALNILPMTQTLYKKVKLNTAIVPIPNYKMVGELKSFLSQFEFVDINYRSTADEDIDFYITTFEELVPVADKPAFIVPLSETPTYHVDLFGALWRTYQQKLNRS